MFSVVLPWYLNLLLLGWLAWPLVFRICTRLHDRGYGLARALGLILTTYLAWLLGNLGLGQGGQPILPFGYTSVLLAAAVVGAVSLVSFLTESRAILSFLRKSARTILFYEVLALAAFLTLVALRAQVPHISYYSTDYALDPLQDYAAEKFTDFAVLNSLLASSSFPPQDAWLAGAGLNYYYFGHLLWACLIKLTGIRPEIGYNLALASVFSLVAIQAASLGYNLTRRKRWALLAAFLIAAASNLDGFLQLLGIAKDMLIGTADGIALSRGWRDWFNNYDFWRSSRAVENTITEFPAFSFVLGDLHAHVSGLVILLAGLGLLLQVARNVGRYPSLLRYELDCWDELFLLALLAGAMSAANSWDSLTFTALTASVIWGARLAKKPWAAFSSRGEFLRQRLSGAVEALLLAGILVLLGSRVFFFAYGRSFDPPLPPLVMSAQAAGIRLERLPKGFDAEESVRLVRRAQEQIRLGKGVAETALLHTARWRVRLSADAVAPALTVASAPLKAVLPRARTSWIEFVGHWILFLAAPACLMFALVRRSLRAPLQVSAPSAAGLPFEEAEPLPPFPPTEDSGESGMSTVSVASGNLAAHPMPKSGYSHGYAEPPSQLVSDPHRVQRFWAISFVGLAVTGVLFPVFQGWVVSLGIVGSGALILLLSSRWFPLQIRLLGALLLTFTVLAVFTELFYVDDIFEAPIERINTVFKVYYGLWPMAALAALLALRRLIRYVPQRRRPRRAALLVVPILILSGTYAVMAPVQRVFRATRLGVPGPGYEGLPEKHLPRLLSADAKPANLEEALDGLRYLRFIHPDDYEAIRWMRNPKNVPRHARILEAAAGQYEYAGRFSTLTGRPALAGWLLHEYGWRGNRFLPERDRRTTTTAEIYTTKNPFKALALLARDEIEYVVLGDTERRKYPALAPGTLAETKFRAIGRLVFQRGSTAIYKINLPDSRGMNVRIPMEAAAEEKVPSTSDQETRDPDSPQETTSPEPSAYRDTPTPLPDESPKTDAVPDAGQTTSPSTAETTST